VIKEPDRNNLKEEQLILPHDLEGSVYDCFGPGGSMSSEDRKENTAGRGQG
jgi:hypothetical protein